jgi:hypothetical protein
MLSPLTIATRNAASEQPLTLAAYGSPPKTTVTTRKHKPSNSQPQSPIAALW